MSKNNQLKTEINELRKDRKNSFDIYKGLQDRVSGLKSNIEDRKKQIEEKQNHINEVKGKIIQIRLDNQEESENYKGEIDGIQKNF